jgi:16S rRNA (adenine1518-N6/adenine1519-N6)-dimethyltransferase
VNAPDPIAQLPPLRDLIREAQLTARKSLGQNFLLDLNITRRIARAAAPLDNVTIIEVGPGPGGLTRALLLEGAKAVIAIEKDRRFEPALRELEAASAGRLRLLFEDALQVEYEALASQAAPVKIVANLPYNIGTPLLTGWLSLEDWPPFFQSITVLLQSEVAERIDARPGTKNYGRLSVLAQVRTQPQLLFRLPPSVFTPPPKVHSSLIQLIPTPQPEALHSIKLLEEVTAAAFGQRRKMLRSSLASLGADSLTLLDRAGITPTARAEELSPNQFVTLAAKLGEMRNKKRS